MLQVLNVLIWETGLLQVLNYFLGDIGLLHVLNILNWDTGLLQELNFFFGTQGASGTNSREYRN